MHRFNDRRYGRFEFSDDVDIETAWKRIESLKLVPVRVFQSENKFGLEVLGISHHFDEVREGEVIPAYDVNWDDYGNVSVTRGR